uniref:CCR4-NOT transcription complex subunit 4 n=1 Tax=Anthurium amnicola TaxID=1678845 RepID=A0A1D1ZAC4_9ARAE
MSAEGEMICPLCLEEMDVTDRQLKPCECGYEVCVWCWHHIIGTAEKDGLQGICPACRSPYDKERILGKTINTKRLAELNAEKKQKLKRSESKILETRAHLGSCRVIQRNVAYLAGLPVNIATYKILQKKEFLGQYGKVLKVVTIKPNTANQHYLSTNSCSVFVTFSKEEEAIRCIQAINGFIFCGRPLKASFGAAKYCESWLKNVPCKNPRCIYLHDAGQQEDICNREDVTSVCASKLLQSCGTTFGNTQNRSGRSFPPPIQSFCSNAAINRAIVNPLPRHVVDYDRNLCPNGDLLKHGVTFNGAYGSLEECSSISSSIGDMAVHGTQVNKPTMSSSLVPNVIMEPDASMQRPATHQNSKQRATSGHHLSFRSGMLDDSFSLNSWEKNDRLSNSTMEHIGPNVGINSVVEGSVNESSYIHKRTNERFCADSRFLCQQSTAMHDVHCSSIGDASASRLHSVVNSTHFDSEDNLIHGGRTVTCRSTDNYASFPQAFSPGVDAFNSISQGTPLSHFQHHAFLGRELMRSADELEAKSMFFSQPKDREIAAPYKRSTIHFMDSKVDSSEASVIIPTSSEHGYQNLSRVCKLDVLDDCHVEYGSEFSLLENDMVQSTCLREETKRDATEEGIISDIFSLDLVPDDPSICANLGKLLLGTNDETISCSNVSTWKYRNSNVSRFCFARVEDSAKASERTFSLSTDECEHNVNLNKLEMVKSYSACQAQSYNLPVSDDIFSEASPPSVPEVTTASRFAFENRASSFPPGFCPQYNALQDCSFFMFPNSDSLASPHARNSFHLSFSDSNHICPSRPTCNHVIQSSNTDSPDYSSPEINQRVSKWGLDSMNLSGLTEIMDNGRVGFWEKLVQPTKR